MGYRLLRVPGTGIGQVSGDDPSSPAATWFAGLEGTAALRGWSGITTAVWAASLPLLLVASLFL